MSALFSYIVHYLTGDFPHSADIRVFFQAYLGHVAARHGINKDGQMNWFHALMYVLVSSFGGSTFAPLWMGRPAGVLSNDMTAFILVTTFLWTYYAPFDVGFKLGNLFPTRLVMTTFSTLFKTMGVVGYVDGAFYAFQDRPSALYPIPIIGPILWATILGNMSSFFGKGFHKHLENGMPWPFQIGLSTASFYHFYANDTTGPIGMLLRRVVQVIPSIQMGLDDRTFAIFVISAFMQSCSLLQMPQFLGPSFSPFVMIQQTFFKFLVWLTNLMSGTRSPAMEATNGGRKKKRKKKNKNTQGPITDYKKEF